MMKDVQGFEDLYSVSEDGRVFSKIKNRFLSNVSRCGLYVSIKMCRNGKQYPTRIHRIVAEAFISNPHGYKDVNHKNGIKTDNRVENLEWTSRSENIKHSYRILKRKKSQGNTHPKSKMVLDLEMGIFYDCAREAATAKGIDKNALLNNIANRKCRNLQKPKFGLCFV